MRRFLAKGILIVCMAAVLSGCHDSKEALDLRTQGIELFNSGDYAGAVAKLDEAIQAGDGYVDDFEKDILKYKAEAELKMGDYAAAVKSYETILDVEKNKAEIMGFLAVAKGRMGDADGALEAIEACGKTENAAKMGSIVSSALIESGKYEDAEVLINRLLEFAAPEYAETLEYNYIVIREKQSDFAGALSACNDFVAKYGADENVEKEITFLKSRIN